MSERDPYDFSPLDDDDFEAEIERLTSEEHGLSLDPADVDDQFRTLQRVIAELSETIADPDLDAEEAWLEALLDEDALSDPGARQARMTEPLP